MNEKAIRSGLERYIQDIYMQHQNYGYHADDSVLYMTEQTYQAISSFFDKDSAVSDHLLLLTMEQAYRHLNQRGQSLAKTFKETKDEDLRLLLRQLKEARDGIDTFITTYRGEPRDNDS